MFKRYLLYLPLAIWLFSCKSASKSFQKGDYTQAIELGVKKLQKNPNDAATRDLVQRSYNYEVTQHEDEIRILSESSNPSRFDQIFDDYKHLQHLYEFIHSYPAVSEQVRTTDYSSYIETYRRQAADVHVSKGDELMRENNRPAYRQAFREYAAAFNYLPDNADIGHRKDDAYNAALVRVVVEPLQSFNGYSYASYFQLSNLQTELMRSLSYHLNNDFVRFYSEGEARSQRIQPDEIMEMSLQRVSIMQPFENRSTRDIEKKVVTKETIVAKDSSIKEYSTIRARMTTTERSLLSETDLLVTVRDPRGGGVLWNDHFTAQYRWKANVVSYTGDDRALGDEERKQLKESGDYKEPNQDYIMQHMLDQLKNDLTFHLKNYYNRYQ
jgi:tetratricopeptide (TPR) repeat protein